MSIQRTKFPLGEDSVLTECLKATRVAPGKTPGGGDQGLLANMVQAFYQHPQVQRVLDLLEYDFKRPELMFQAMTHSTFTHEFTLSRFEHNEKLEFLGDAILDAAISVEIFHRFPQVDEGHLSKLRGSIVNQNRLSALALYLGLDHCLLLGRGEIKRRQQGIGLDSLLANALEALIAAIFLDSSFAEAAQRVVHLIHLYEKQEGMKIFHLEALQEFDAKTRLQEITMNKYKTLPQYRVLGRNLDPHPWFEVALLINGHEILRVEEGSKKKAEKTLALMALKSKLYENVPPTIENQNQDKAERI